MPSIRDFSGGVLNQELQNRDNGNGVLFDCKNVLSSWNGELRKRTGTAWLATLPEYQRIIPYRLPSGNDIILLLADNHIYGYEFAGEESIRPFYIFSGEAPTFPTSGWAGNTTNGDYTIWLSSSSASSTWGLGFDLPTQTRPMTYYGKGSLWTGGYGTTTNVPAYIRISSEEPQLLNSLRLRWTNTCNGNHPGHYKGWLEPTLQYSDDGENWTSIQTEMTNPVPFGGADYYSGSYHYGLGASEKTENHIVYQVTNVSHGAPHKHWRIYCARRIPNTQTYDGERIDLNVSDIKYLSDEKSQLIIDTSSDFQINEENIDSIKYDQSDNLMILTNGTDSVYYLRYSAGTMNYGTYTMSFDSEQGKPSCVCFYQNRLWLGGFSAFPTRVWGSAFGNFTDFTIPQTVLATSAIYADSVEIKSRIENMWGGNNALYCLSEDGISMIDAQGGIVATNQIEFKLRNREPVDNMTPTYKDDIMIYLGRDRRKILVTDYDLIVQRFKAQNMSENYTDFLLRGIRELHYIPDRHSLVYGLLQNGAWFALLFDIAKGKNALYPFDTNGFIFDVQPVKYGDKTRLCMVTQRDGVFMLEEKLFAVDQEIMDFMSEEERVAYSKYILSKGNAYLDCLVKKTFDEPTDTITDIPFSVDSKIAVIADGIYLGEKQLSPSITSGLYAWEHDGNVIYTNTETPSVSDLVFNDDQSEKTGYDIIDIVTGGIVVQYTDVVTSRYYCWARNTTVDATGLGTLARNPSGDGTRTVTSRTHGTYTQRIFGWGNYTALSPYWYEGQRVPLQQIINGNSYNAITGWNNEYIYVKESVPATGYNVYNSDFVQSGTVTEYGSKDYGTIEDVPGFINNGHIYMNYLITGGNEYYRMSSKDTEHSSPVEATETFYRNPALDVTAQGISLKLDEPASEIIMGYTYDSYAVLKFVSPYNLRKFPKEISVNFINSGYLEVGNTFDSLKSVLNNLVESVTIDNKKILMNGNYTKTLDKQAFETPYVIVRSDKGLPFIITGIDYKVDTSNYQGGV